LRKRLHLKILIKESKIVALKTSLKKSTILFVWY